MKMKEYVKDKLYLILLSLCIAVIMISFLFAGGVNTAITIMLMLLYGGVIAAFLIIEYIRRNRYYRQVSHTLKQLEEKYLLTEIIKEPSFLDGKILYQTLKETDKSMADQLHMYKHAQAEYKSFVEMWVHEIKTPLAAAELIISNHPSDISDSLVDEIKKVESYVEQALFYARSTNVEKDYIVKKVNLEESIQNVIRKHTKIFIMRHIALQLHDVDVHVYTDDKWLEFILDQIITNALKYMDKEESILQIYAEKEDHAVVLHIKDNGIGIEESDIHRIFERGFTGKNGRIMNTATGLGLYLCKSLCDKLYLGIEASSQPNVYTMISLRFPIGHNQELY